ncbi:MAG: mechanosensitive ion channel [Candidatus Micrarchaeia archaeon]
MIKSAIIFVFSFILGLIARRILLNKKGIWSAISWPIFWIFFSVGLFFALMGLPIPLDFENLKTLFIIIWTIIGVILFAEVGSYFIDEVGRKKPQLSYSIPILKKIFYIIIIFIALIIILSALKIEISPLVASLGITTLAIALALQDTLSNFFAGMNIASERRIKIGDEIKVENYEGKIVDIGWRTTKLATSNGEIILPNKKLSDSIIVRKVSGIETAVGGKNFVIPISYENNLNKVEKIVRKVLENIKRKYKVNSNFSFDDFGENVNLSIFIETKENNS